MPTHLPVTYCTATSSRLTCTACTWAVDTGDTYPFRTPKVKASGEVARRKRKIRHLTDAMAAFRDHYADIIELRSREATSRLGEPADELLARHGVQTTEGGRR